MSNGIHLISNTIPGYGRSEVRCHLCSRTSGAVSLHSYHMSCNSYLPIKIALMDNPVYGSKRTSIICSVNSNNPRRNPDFSRQNRNPSFSRNKNRPNMEREKTDNYDESEYLASKNGLLSLSNSPRYQATATPGTREKEIVELFRKVQAQLRARAAIKEEKKMESSQGQGKETETVDSLLRLLRKHSVDQGKRRNVSDEDFTVDQPNQRNSVDEEQNINFFESSASAKAEAQESHMNSFRRPPSNFRRRSPVPRVKYQPVYSVEEDAISNSPLHSQGRRKKTVDEPELVPFPVAGLQPDNETDTDPDIMPYIASSEVHEDDDVEFDVMSESDSESEEEVELELEPEFSATDKAHSNKIVETPSLDQQDDLSVLKLPALRALAKSRGVKGFYKLKKAELVAILSGDSV